MQPGRLILEVKNLQTNFRVGNEDISIIRGVSFSARQGETLAIVGESGCGRRRYGPLCDASSSEWQTDRRRGYISHDIDNNYDLHNLEPFGKEMRAIRGRKIGMIFQDPMASLNPVYRVGDQVAENLLQHFKMSKEARERIVEMFASLGIPDRLEG